MKKNIVRSINRLLEKFGARLVSAETDSFTMDKALERLARHHNISVQSVIDIGASNGIWTKKAMTFLPESRFLAIEPLIERESALKKLQADNENFSYALCVAGERDEIVSISVSRDLDGSTVGAEGENMRDVPSKNLDSLVLENGCLPPYLLKFDTHGYELPILKGARNTLAETNIIIMEVYNFQITESCLRFPEMCLYLEDKGFRPFDLVDPMLREHDNSLWQMDLLFCRKDRDIFSHNQFS